MNPAFTRLTQIQYQDSIAPGYRASDEAAARHPDVVALAGRLAALTSRFSGARVVEIGCGTGRYFYAVKNTRELVGIDPSQNMLNQARHPIFADQVTAKTITLIHSGFLDYQSSEPFDIAYSFGVLGEHAPFGDVEAAHANQLLKQGGYFMITLIDPLASPSYFIKQLFKKFFRMLGVGNRFRFMTTCAYGLNFPFRFKKVLRKNGFKIESVDRIMPEHAHYLVIAQKV